MRWLPLFLLLGTTTILAQTEEKEKDNSKPTNVYSQIDNFLQFESTPDFKTYGYNPRFSYAPNEGNSLVLEVPFLYSTLEGKFGIGDPRLRYFAIPYKDYTKFFGSFGAALDVFFPLGSYENGLGSSSWRISPGLTFGLILNQSQTISIFPVVSYVFTSEPTTSQIPEDLKETDHGVSIQFISSFIINQDAFILFTPIIDYKDLGDIREDSYLFEIETVFDILRDKYQVGTFYRGNVSANSHLFSLYFTVFL